MATENTNPATPPKSDTPNDVEHPHEVLPLPPPPEDGETQKLDMSSGQGTVKLDHLGPLVVNRDGTLSRIANWDKMAEIERQNTLRILGKRNQLRMETLKADEEGRETKE